MIYYIPLIGWIVAVIQYEKANRQYWRVHKNFPSEEYNKAYAQTWITYDNTMKAFLCTSLGLAAFVIIPIVFEK